MTHILITDLREIRYITGKIESVPLDPEKDTLSFDREEDRELAIKLIRAKYMKSTDSLYDVKPGIYQVPVEVEVVTVCDTCGVLEDSDCDIYKMEECDFVSKKVARIVQPKEESQEELWRELIDAYDLTDQSSYGYGSLIKKLSSLFTITRKRG